MTETPVAPTSRVPTAAISIGAPLVGLVVGIPATLASATAASYLSWLPDLVTGWLFFAVAGWTYRSSRTATVFGLLIGVLWFLGSVLPIASLWHRGAIAHLIVAWPGLRPIRPIAIAAVVVGYAVNLVPTFGGSGWVAIAFCGLLMAAGTIRRQIGTGGWLPLTAAIAFGAGLVGGIALQTAIPGSAGVYSGLLAYELGVAAIAVMLAAAAIGRRDRDVADLIIELRAKPVAAGRRTIALPRAIAGSEDPEIAEALATAERLTTANRELEDAARARLVALTASRDRLTAAEAQERARIRRILGEELTPLYGEVTEALSGLPSSPIVERIRDRAADSAAEVDALWNELDAPDRTLVDLDLEDLVARCPIPVVIEGMPRKLPAQLGALLRSTCSETMLNAVKHAASSVIQIRGMRRSGRWIILIADDGRGGASLRDGGGLRALMDRASDLGARLDVSSPAGAGTRVTLELPRFSRRAGPHRP